MRTAIIEIKDSKNAILKINFLDSNAQRVATVELDHTGLYDYVSLNGVPVLILKGLDSLYISFNINYGGHAIEISSDKNNKKKFKFKSVVNRMIVEDKNHLVTINPQEETEKPDNYTIYIAPAMKGIRKIDMIKQLIENINLRMEEAKEIVNNKKGNVCVTKTQAQYLGERLTNFVKITKEEA